MTESTVLEARSCTSMDEVRREIDRLDRELVRLLAERQGFVEQAGRIKPNRDRVRDNARIEDVISKVLTTAREKGLDARIAEPVWRTLIEQSIAREYEIFDQRG